MTLRRELVIVKSRELNKITEECKMRRWCTLTPMDINSTRLLHTWHAEIHTCDDAAASQTWGRLSLEKLVSGYANFPSSADSVNCCHILLACSHHELTGPWMTDITCSLIVNQWLINLPDIAQETRTARVTETQAQWRVCSRIFQSRNRSWVATAAPCRTLIIPWT